MDRIMSMRVFQAVIDNGGFASAARSLNISPAWVSRAVSDLEDHLGTRLIQRSTRRFNLTAAGENYLQRVRIILQKIDDAHMEANLKTQKLVGELRILASPILATHVLAPMVANFRKLYPQIHLNITVRSAIEHSLEAHDVTLLIKNTLANETLTARQLFSTKAVLVASPEYLDSRGTPKVPLDLMKHDCLRYMEVGMRDPKFRLFDSENEAIFEDLEIHPVIRTNHSDSLVRAALDGAGIASLSIAIAAPLFASGKLTHVLPTWISGKFVLYAAFPSRNFLPSRTQVFLDYLETDSWKALHSVVNASE